MPLYLRDNWDPEGEAAQQAAVRAAMTDEQKAMGHGDHFLRAFRMAEGFPLIHMFGRVWSLEEMATKMGPDELESRQANEENFLYCSCYWPECPDGDRDDVNRYDMWPISPQQFEMGREYGWFAGHPLIWPWYRELGLKMVRTRGDIP